MIEIKVDKRSELEWIMRVIDAGVCNLGTPYTLKFLGVPLKQNVNYKPSDIYEEDITDKIKEYNKRFPNNGISGMQTERILKDELRGR